MNLFKKMVDNVNSAYELLYCHTNVNFIVLVVDTTYSKKNELNNFSGKKKFIYTLKYAPQKWFCICIDQY